MRRNPLRKKRKYRISGRKASSTKSAHLPKMTQLPLFTNLLIAFASDKNIPLLASPKLIPNERNGKNAIVNGLTVFSNSNKSFSFKSSVSNLAAAICTIFLSYNLIFNFSANICANSRPPQPYLRLMLITIFLSNPIHLSFILNIFF